MRDTPETVAEAVGYALKVLLRQFDNEEIIVEGNKITIKSTNGKNPTFTLTVAQE